MSDNVTKRELYEATITLTAAFIAGHAANPANGNLVLHEGAIRQVAQGAHTIAGELANVLGLTVE